ncbi:MAG: YggT family protein [Gammaproteobacteria bacterium]|jgi:YggT family protein
MSGGNYLINAGVYLINILFGLYIIVVMLRFILQTIRADFYNPICQFLVTVTNPALKPLRRWIPGYFGIDWPSVLLMVTLQLLEVCLIALLMSGQIPAMISLPVIIVSKLLKLLIYTYIVIIVIQAIISWVQPGSYSPFTVLLYQMSDPLVKPIRRHIPAAGGIDWSIFLVLILLNLALILLVAPLQDLGNHLSGYPRQFF